MSGLHISEIKMVEHNRFYIIRFYPYTIHKLRREIGFGVLNVSLKQACRCATQWRSVYHVSNGVSCIQRCFFLNHLINCSLREQILS